MENVFSAIEGILWLAFLLFMYLLPSGIAYRRRHKHVEAIFILNLLAGWTGIGWVGAMVWAFVN